MFFRLSSLELGLLIFGLVLGTTVLGVVVGRRLRAHADALGAGRRPPGCAARARRAHPRVRPDDGRRALRRATRRSGGRGERDRHHLRAQMLREPMRTRSLEQLVRYTDTALLLSTRCREARLHARRSRTESACSARSGASRERLSPARRPTAPRLYVETLNEMIDLRTVRVSALNNRVPGRARDRGRRRRGRAGPPRPLPGILARGVLAVVLASAFVSCCS